MTTSSYARHPRGIVNVIINGTAGSISTSMPFISWDVDSNSNYRADTFRTELPLSAMPKGFDANWWSWQQEIYVEIFGGIPTDPENFTDIDLTSHIYGKVDDIEHDLVRNLIVLTGRDMTASLLDTLTNEKWQNMTAVMILAAIASAHNMTINITEATASNTKKLGSYFNNEFAVISRLRNDWDLLCWIAQQEQMTVYVRGTVIYYQPLPDPKKTDLIYSLEYRLPNNDCAVPESDAIDIRFSRNLTLARDVIVKVKSWTLDNITKPFIAQSHKKHAAGSPGKPQVYEYSFPNLSPDAARAKADALAKEITAHEIRMTAVLPGDEVLDVNTIVRVSGTGTKYDQDYYPDSIRRSLSFEGGYSMQLMAKNSSQMEAVA